MIKLSSYFYLAHTSSLTDLKLVEIINGYVTGWLANAVQDANISLSALAS